MKEADGYTNCKKKDTMEFSIKRAKSSGSMPEWLMGADCKSAGYAYAGSNPARPISTNGGVSEWFKVLVLKTSVT